VYTITEATDVFQVDNITGVITVKDSALLDRETHDKHQRACKFLFIPWFS